VTSPWHKWSLNGGASDAATTAGEVNSALLSLLESDLSKNTKPVVFVVRHEPAFPQPDAAPPHRLRHEEDSLDAFPANRDAFWDTLVAYGVIAHFCGHTHNYNIVRMDGVWQIDAGHARGMADTGAPSTFIRISVWKVGGVTYETYRQNLSTQAYRIADLGNL
jgi:hypothetical protein